ncbi:MAG: diaminopimelate epimerase [Betaproteobacteria bacterium]|nr:MAG: diaminopimelate epimerase [Betaproteobacteria bacterium]
MRFSRYHALGNDYLVVDPADHPIEFSISETVRICHRHYGIGSDGILWGPLPATTGAKCALRIFNPDGSEAQKSGNGLRIFCRHLYDHGLVGDEPFAVETKGGIVQARVLERGACVRIEMGRVSFRSDRIPVAGPVREVLRESLAVNGVDLQVSCATIGNPHCVVELPAGISPSEAKSYAVGFGPMIETHEWFPERTNVQFLRVLDPKNIAIEIWERGAGYTLASGSSSSAAASVARRLGLVGPDMTVHMPGGKIEIELNESFDVIMTGGVTAIATGELLTEALAYSATNE